MGFHGMRCRMYRKIGNVDGNTFGSCEGGNMGAKGTAECRGEGRAGDICRKTLSRRDDMPLSTIPPIPMDA